MRRDLRLGMCKSPVESVSDIEASEVGSGWLENGKPTGWTWEENTQDLGKCAGVKGPLQSSS